MQGQRGGSAARVGFVIFIATLLVVLAVYLVGDGGMFVEQARYRVLFPTTSGLRPDARVYISGVPAGKVEDIGFSRDPDEPNIVVTLSVNAKYVDRIRSDSFAWIQGEGLLGDKAVWIKMGTPEKPRLPENAPIPSGDRSLLHEIAPELASGTSDLLENMIMLLKEVNAGKGTLGQLLRNPELYDSINRFSLSLAVTSQEMEGIAKDMKLILQDVRAQKGTLGKLIFSEEYAAEFQTALKSASSLMGSLGELVEGVQKGEGLLGKLMRDQKLYDNLTAALDKVGSAASRVDKSLGALSESKSTLGLLMQDKEMGERVANMLKSLEAGTVELSSILRKVNDGQGTVSMLLNDPSIAWSMRDVFLGVQDSDFLKGVVRRAERKGNEIRLRDERLAIRSTREETSRQPAPVEPPSSQPAPAAGREGEGSLVPAPAPTPEKQESAMRVPPGVGQSAPFTRIAQVLAAASVLSMTLAGCAVERSYVTQTVVLEAVARAAKFQPSESSYTLRYAEVAPDTITFHFAGVEHPGDRAWVTRFAAKSSEQRPEALVNLAGLLQAIAEDKEEFQVVERGRRMFKGIPVESASYQFRSPVFGKEGRFLAGGVAAIAEVNRNPTPVIYHLNVTDIEGNRTSLGWPELEPLVAAIPR